MRWKRGRRSSNIEDRRGSMVRQVGLPRGLPRSPVARRGGLGIVGLIVVGIIYMFLGGDPGVLLQQGPSLTTQVPDTSLAGGGRPPAVSGRRRDELTDFVSVVLADTEDTWHELFSRSGLTYREPVLVLFTDAVESACGFAQAAAGPFYCPADQKLYIDLGFYDELKGRFDAPGDFAQAYVIAHEVGHHVQSLLGISQEVQKLRSDVSEQDANTLSVMLELQADCLAGIWAHHAQRTRNILETGDIEEGLNAAAAIGDDRLQRQARGYVVPESFTHGSSAQRVRWFRQGLSSGDIPACDTFNAEQL